jgi:hypothetical protein
MFWKFLSVAHHCANNISISGANAWQQVWSRCTNFLGKGNSLYSVDHLPVQAQFRKKFVIQAACHSILCPCHCTL